jgi:hypothetical protein
MLACTATSCHGAGHCMPFVRLSVCMLKRRAFTAWVVAAATAVQHQSVCSTCRVSCNPCLPSGTISDQHSCGPTLIGRAHICRWQRPGTRACVPVAARAGDPGANPARSCPRVRTEAAHRISHLPGERTPEIQASPAICSVAMSWPLAIGRANDTASGCPEGRYDVAKVCAHCSIDFFAPWHMRGSTPMTNHHMVHRRWERTRRRNGKRFPKSAAASGTRSTFRCHPAA